MGNLGFKTKKAVYALIVLVLLQGSHLLLFNTNKSFDLIGIYKSESLGFFDKYKSYFFENTWGSISGQQLILKPDSTYIYQTCGHILEGKWTILKERLVLTQESRRWKIDSLNDIEQPIEQLYQGYLDFKISENELTSVFLPKQKKHKLKNWLVKVH